MNDALTAVCDRCPRRRGFDSLEAAVDWALAHPHTVTINPDDESAPQPSLAGRVRRLVGGA